MVLGVDPGFSATGFAVMNHERQRTSLADCGLLRLNREQPLAARTRIFYEFFQEKIYSQQIEHLALETPFLGKNSQSFLKLGYLRGILYLLSAQHNLTLYEYSPMQVKLAVTGFGGASKEQVGRVVYQLFPRLAQQQKADVTDAIAVALCCVWQMPFQEKLARLPISGKKSRIAEE